MADACGNAGCREETAPRRPGEPARSLWSGGGGFFQEVHRSTKAVKDAAPRSHPPGQGLDHHQPSDRPDMLDALLH